eukprot:Clim_evm6s57 gene=Clim_evmTU6s57
MENPTTDFTAAMLETAVKGEIRMDGNRLETGSCTSTSGASAMTETVLDTLQNACHDIDYTLWSVKSKHIGDLEGFKALRERAKNFLSIVEEEINTIEQDQVVEDKEQEEEIGNVTDADTTGFEDLLDKTVLIVDDSHIACKVMKKLLCNVGFSRVRVAHNGAEVYLDNSADIIISDLCMPQMDGFTLGRMVRARCSRSGSLASSQPMLREDSWNKSTSLDLVSGEGQNGPGVRLNPYVADDGPLLVVCSTKIDECMDELVEAGFNDYLCKPMRPGNLKALLRRISWSLRNAERT